MSPAPVSHGDALLAAVTGVAENSLFAFADASDQAAFDAVATALAVEGGLDWLRASIDFGGPLAGRFELTLPESLTRRLCASFAGAETADEIADGDLVDFTGELANIMCGSWLTRSCRHEPFTLTPPRVHRGLSDSAAASHAGSERFYLSIDEAPIRLELRWAANESKRPAVADGR